MDPPVAGNIPAGRLEEWAKKNHAHFLVIVVGASLVNFADGEKWSNDVLADQNQIKKAGNHCSGGQLSPEYLQTLRGAAQCGPANSAVKPVQ